MSDLSEEMQRDLLQEIDKDAIRIHEKMQVVWHQGYAFMEKPQFVHHDLEELVYITEQIRLKLRMLGAPRIYQ